MKFLKNRLVTKYCTNYLNTGCCRRFNYLSCFILFIVAVSTMIIIYRNEHNQTQLRFKYILYTENIFPRPQTMKNKNEADRTDTKVPKVILVWTPFENDLFNYFGYTEKVNYVKNHCSVNNCIVTDNRSYFGDNVERFDAIIFNGKGYSNWKDADLLDMPKHRTPYQIYIFYETRSAYEYPICIDNLNNFFNWTMSYRLDSDIPVPFFVIKNKTGHIIGPKINTEWVNEDANTTRVSNENIPHPAVLWFENVCTFDSEFKKIELVNRLIRSLQKVNVGVDVLGKCHLNTCKDFNCNKVKKGYYQFYLPLESLDNPDYVNSDLLKYMKFNLVPIVLGGINFNNFMPYHSYIEGNNLTYEVLASLIVNSSFDLESYFHWKKYYTYEKTKSGDSLCSLCAAVSDEKKFNATKVYGNFQKWWNSNYKTRCKELFNI